MTRAVANNVLPSYLANSPRPTGQEEADIIVSFTSFPARIDKVWLVVECMLRQTLLPKKIILWLSKEQFPTSDSVPRMLRDYENGRFEIRYMDGDIRSYKKFYYTIQEFPNHTFVTCDDDIYYHPDMLKSLVDTSLKFPGYIIANTTRQITYDKSGELNPYHLWKIDFEAYDYKNRVQIGVGGVLYPPGCLHNFVTRKDLFIHLAPMADDLWLNLMARLEGTPIMQSAQIIMPLPIKSTAPKLNSINNGVENMNDKQISQLRSWFLKEGFGDVYAQK